MLSCTNNENFPVVTDRGFHLIIILSDGLANTLSSLTPYIFKAYNHTLIITDSGMEFFDGVVATKNN